jgi:leucyl aminopeptidase (aminopeptidase T)
MHGLNDTILASGLAVDYNEVSRLTEKLRHGMTEADHVEIDFEVDGKKYHLFIELGKQNAQKSHGICREGPDIANLPAGEVYFVPQDAKGDFPIKFESDGTLGVMHVSQGRVENAKLIRGNQKTIDAMNHRLATDPSTGILGELGFGTQVLPYSGSDIQDEKIFGTFHLATGRNDHLSGSVTLDRFVHESNASHDDIENYEPSNYLWNLLK